jgi:hypothetical protein
MGKTIDTTNKFDAIKIALASPDQDSNGLSVK